MGVHMQKSASGGGGGFVSVTNADALEEEFQVLTPSSRRRSSCFFEISYWYEYKVKLGHVLLSLTAGVTVFALVVSVTTDCVAKSSGPVHSSSSSSSLALQSDSSYSRFLNDSLEISSSSLAVTKAPLPSQSVTTMAPETQSTTTIAPPPVSTAPPCSFMGHQFPYDNCGPRNISFFTYCPYNRVCLELAPGQYALHLAGDPNACDAFERLSFGCQCIYFLRMDLDGFSECIDDPYLNTCPEFHPPNKSTKST